MKRCALALALLLLCVSAAAAIPPGSAKLTADLAGVTLDVFTYRPAGCSPAGLLLVFHGLDRNASTYRDDAVPIADRMCLIVAAPLFDPARFPTSRYQRGGIVEKQIIQRPDQWTARYVLALAAWLRAREGNAAMPYDLIGHSAGAQLLGRVAAFTPTQARRIVIANPSTYVLPNLDVAAPYGFGGMANAEALLQAYLAQPVTIMLGQDDKGSKNLADDDEARAQGTNRYDRGSRTFAAARSAAAAHGWTFNWRLIEVPGVGHNARSMFASPQAIQALAGQDPP